MMGQDVKNSIERPRPEAACLKADQLPLAFVTLIIKENIESLNEIGPIL